MLPALAFWFCREPSCVSGRRHSNQRKVNGILLLDKPAGLTSNAALQQVKKLFRARKAGGRLAQALALPPAERSRDRHNISPSPSG